MTLRSAKPSDARGLGELHIRSWQGAYEGLLPQDFLDGLRVESRVKWFERRIQQRTPIIVVEHEGVAGFCLLGPTDSPAVGEVYAIYVDPPHWGHGHGHALMGAAEAALEEMGFSEAQLWVLDTNARARRFYERQGWSLGDGLKLETIGETQVTERRYFCALPKTI